MMRFHQTQVLSHVKAQKHPKLIGKDHAHQHIIATLQSLGRGTIMLRIDHQNHRTTVTPGEGFDHHHLITGEDILGAHQ